MTVTLTLTHSRENTYNRARTHTRTHENAVMPKLVHLRMLCRCGQAFKKCFDVDESLCTGACFAAHVHMRSPTRRRCRLCRWHEAVLCQHVSRAVRNPRSLAWASRVSSFPRGQQCCLPSTTRDKVNRHHLTLTQTKGRGHKRFNNLRIESRPVGLNDMPTLKNARLDNSESKRTRIHAQTRVQTCIERDNFT